MIGVTWSGTDRRAVANLVTATPRVLQALKARMDIEMQSLESFIRAEKLEGDPLRHRSGHLQSSVQAGESTITNGIVEGHIQGGGGLAPYGIVHERGGVFTIPEHTRRMALSASGGRVRLLTKAGLTSTRKQINFVRTDIVVREHEAEYPMRSFMRSSWEEQQPGILARLRTAAATAMQEAINAGNP